MTPQPHKGIPSPLAATVSEALAVCYTHAELDLLFSEAGAPGDPPPGSKPVKALAWLRRVRDEMPDSALQILGQLLERLMEQVLPSDEDVAAPGPGHWAFERRRQRDRVRAALAQAGLGYINGGHIMVGGMHVAARQLGDLSKHPPSTAVLIAADWRDA